MDIDWEELDLAESLAAVEMLLDMESFSTHASLLQSGVRRLLSLASACSEMEAQLVSKAILECEGRCSSVVDILLDQLPHIQYPNIYYRFLPSFLSVSSPNVASAIMTKAKSMLRNDPSLLLPTLHLLADMPTDSETITALQLLINEAVDFIEDHNLPNMLRVIVKCQSVVYVQDALTKVRLALLDVSDDVLTDYTQTLIEVRQTSPKMMSSLMDLISDFSPKSFPFVDVLPLIVAFSSPLRGRVERVFNYWLRCEYFPFHLLSRALASDEKSGWTFLNPLIWQILYWLVQRVSRLTIPSYFVVRLYKIRLGELISKLFMADITFRETILNYLIRLVFECDRDEDTEKPTLPPIGSAYSYQRSRMKVSASESKCYHLAETCSQILYVLYSESDEKATIGHSIYSSLLLRLLPDNECNVYLIPEAILARLFAIVTRSVKESTTLHGMLMIGCQKLLGVAQSPSQSTFLKVFSRQDSKASPIIPSEFLIIDSCCQYRLSDIGLMLANGLMTNSCELNQNDYDTLLELIFNGLCTASDTSLLISLRVFIFLLANKSRKECSDRFLRSLTSNILGLIKGCDFLSSSTDPHCYMLSIDTLSSKVKNLLEELLTTQSNRKYEIESIIPRLFSELELIIALILIIHSNGDGNAKTATKLRCLFDQNTLSEMDYQIFLGSYFIHKVELEIDVLHCVSKVFSLAYYLGALLHEVTSNAESGKFSPVTISYLCNCVAQIDILRCSSRYFKKSKKDSGRPASLKFRYIQHDAQTSLIDTVSSALEKVVFTSRSNLLLEPLCTALSAIMDQKVDGDKKFVYSHMTLSLYCYLATVICCECSANRLSGVDMHDTTCGNALKMNDVDTVLTKMVLMLPDVIMELERCRKRAIQEGQVGDSAILRLEGGVVVDLGSALDHDGLVLFALVSYLILFTRVHEINATAVDSKFVSRMVNEDKVLSCLADTRCGDTATRPATIIFGNVYSIIENQVKLTQDLAVATAGFNILVEMAHGASLRPRLRALAFLMSTLAYSRQVRLQSVSKTTRSSIFRSFADLTSLSSLSRDFISEKLLSCTQDKVLTLLNSSLHHLDHRQMYERDYNAAFAYLTAWWFLKLEINRLLGLNVIFFDVLSVLRGGMEFSQSRVGPSPALADSLVSLGKRAEPVQEVASFFFVETPQPTPKNHRKGRKLRRIIEDDNEGIGRSRTRFSQVAWKNAERIDGDSGSNSSPYVPSFTYMCLENIHEFFILGFSLLPATIGGLHPFPNAGTFENNTEGPYSLIVDGFIFCIWILKELVAIIKQNDHPKFMLEISLALTRGCGALCEAILESVQKCSLWRNSRSGDSANELNGGLKFFGELIAWAFETASCAHNLITLYKRHFFDEGDFHLNKIVKRTLPSVIEKCFKHLKLLGDIASMHSVDLHDLLKGIRKSLLHSNSKGSTSWVFSQQSHFKMRMIEVVESPIDNVGLSDEFSTDNTYCSLKTLSAESKPSFEASGYYSHSHLSIGWNLYQI